MPREEGAEQHEAELLSVKPLNIDIKTAKPKDQGTRLSVCSKLCFAFGGVPYQMTAATVAFFLQIYLLDVALLHPSHASIILFVGHVWDAITDPIVGILLSRSKWTRIGCIMPWLLFSAPFVVLTYFLIWYVPPFEEGNVIWYVIFYCLFQTMMTCFYVPYSALTMFISSDQSERDSATAYRMVVEVLGTVLGTGIQGQIVGGAATNCTSMPDDQDSGNLTEINTLGVSLDDKKKAYLIASGVICIIIVLCVTVVLLGVKEQKESVQKKSQITFRQGFCLVMGYGPYVKLIIGFLFTSLGLLLTQGNFALFITYTLGQRNDYQNIIVVLMLSGVVFIPLTQWFLTWYGKKKAFYIGNLWAIPCLIIIVCVESNLIVSYVFAVAIGVSVAVSFLLPWSMLPDVVDDFTVKNPHIKGHEAIFYSFYVFFLKFATGVSLGVSTLSLNFAGYVTGSCSQPDSITLTLKLLVCAVPVCLLIIGVVTLFFYPIDEERRKANKKSLEEMRSNTEADSESETAALGSSE